ncbi:MAG: response regulator [Nitrospirae bacterium]|nr:response regulator [Nitrospirota bacterium]
MLVVDDNKDVLNSFAGCIASMGVQVDKAHDYKSAMKLILNEDDYDFLFIDNNLPVENEGVRLIKDTAEKGKCAKHGIYLLTGAKYDTLTEEKLLEIGVNDILLKPISSVTLRDVISGDYNSSLNLLSSDGNADVMGNTVFKHAEKDFSIILFDIEKSLSILYDEACDSISFDKYCIFKSKDNGQTISIFYSKRINESAVNQQIHKLTTSPIRNIISTNKPTHVDAIVSEWIAPIKDIIPDVTSMLGYPISVQGKVTYVMSFFNTANKSFDESDLKKGLIISDRLSLILEKNELKQLFESELIFSIIGRLGIGLNHEMRNRLQSIDSEITTIKSKWADLSTNKSRLDKTFISGFSKSLNEFTKYVNNLNSLIELFLSPVYKKRLPNINLVSTIREYVVMVKPEADAHNVKIEFEPITGNMPAYIYFSSLILGQILTNLLLNAIHHNDKKQGIVKIRMKYEAQENHPITIEVEDNGCGIHGKDYGVIFDALYTTKKTDERTGKGGLGMGLYIAKHLALSISAILELKESYVYTGSTFQIKLPMLIGEK